MASSRFAISITCSAGTNRNSASGSTNFLISHGQATRSTFTRSRVTHFIRHLLSVARDRIVALDLSELHESVAWGSINGRLLGSDQPRLELLLTLPHGNNEPVAL